jgi:hypothetical protein
MGRGMAVFPDSVRIISWICSGVRLATSAAMAAGNGGGGVGLEIGTEGAGGGAGLSLARLIFAGICGIAGVNGAGGASLPLLRTHIPTR